MALLSFYNAYRYLNTLLSHTMSTDNNLIREFLEVDENMLSKALEQAKACPDTETSYDQRLDEIVKDTRR